MINSEHKTLAEQSTWEVFKYLVLIGSYLEAVGFLWFKFAKKFESKK